MNIRGDHTLAAGQEAVWDLLLDPEVLSEALPGVQRFEPQGPDRYLVTITIGIAPLKGTYDLMVGVSDKRRPGSYRLTMEGVGSRARTRGSALVSLRPSGAATLVAYDGEAEVHGAAAAAGSRLLTGAAKLLIGQFFKGMDRQVRERVP